MLSGLGSIAVGYFLGTTEEIFKSLPGLLILVPPLLHIKGAIGGAFSAQLSTALHLGTIQPTLRKNTKEFKHSFTAMMILSVILPVWIGTLAYLLCFILIGASGGYFSLLQFILIAELTSIIASAFQALIIIFSAYLTYRRGLDPDVIVSPILYMTGDATGVISLILVIYLLGSLGVL